MDTISWPLCTETMNDNSYITMISNYILVYIRLGLVDIFESKPEQGNMKAFKYTNCHAKGFFSKIKFGNNEGIFHKQANISKSLIFKIS